MKTATHRLGEAAERSSFGLSNRREEFIWKPGEDGQSIETSKESWMLPDDIFSWPKVTVISK